MTPWCKIPIILWTAGALTAAAEDPAFHPLFNGADLKGWKTPADISWAWTVKDGVIHGITDEKAHGKELWTEAEYGDFILELDWRFPDPPVKKALKIIGPDGSDVLNPDGSKKKELVTFAGDSGILIRGDVMSQINIVCKSAGSGELYGYRKKKPDMPPEVRAACVPKLRADHEPGAWNHFTITARGETITVELNGKLVIDHARMPGLPARGPIALQHHGEGIEFRNVRIRELGGASSTLKAAAIEAGLRLVDQPILWNGRVELLWLLREQSVSETLHRYGNVLPTPEQLGIPS
jgi:hypothetical protein